MRKTKDGLVKAITSLVKEGEDLKKTDDENSQNEEAGWFSRWKVKRGFENSLTEFKSKYFALEEEF
jgi:hypothetical protein